MRRQTEKRVIAAAILAAFSFAGILVLVAVLTDPRTYERALASYVQRRLDRTITYVSEGITLWPWIGLRLRDVKVSRRPPQAGRYLLTAKALHIQVRLLPLLFRRIVVRGIVIDEPDLAVVRDAHGRMALADLGGEPEPQPAGGKTIQKRVTSLFVARTKIRNGRLLLVDRGAQGVRPVTTRVTSLDLDLGRLAPDVRQEFDLRATLGPAEQGRRIALRGWIGPFARGQRIFDLPMDLRLRAEAFDPRPFRSFLPEKVRRRVPAGAFTVDLRIEGKPGGVLEARGDLRVARLDWPGDSWRLSGEVKGSMDGVRRGGRIEGTADLKLDPGAFTKGSFALRGRSTIKTRARRGRAVIQIDATDSEYRHGDVFVKRPGTRLLVKGTLYGAREGLVVEDASGVIHDLPFTGAADIGRPVRAGRSTPFSLHFQPGTLDLSDVRRLVAATIPFALRGEAEITRLDIVRRPEERREWQVTTDFRLSEAAALIPLPHGAAHTIEDLDADVRIIPGLLVAERARGTINHVPLAFHARAREFMTILTGSPRRPRAQITYEARQGRVDFDRLLAPGRAAPGLLVPGASLGPREARAQEAPDPAHGAASASQISSAPSSRGTDGLPLDPLRRFVVTRGEITARQAVYARQQVTNVRTVHAYDDPVVTLQQTRLDAWGGAWDVTGTTVLDGGPSFSLRVKADRARVEQITDALSTTKRPPTIFGILSGEGTLEGRGKTVAAWEKALRGQGHVVILDGRLPAFNVFETVIRAMLGIFRKILPVKQDVTFTEPTTFDRFETPWRVKDGRVITEGLSLVTDDYHLTGQGSFGLDRTLDYDTRVALTPQGIQKMIVVASLPIVGRSFENLAPIPMRVRGTFEKPQLYPEVSGFTPDLLRGILTGVGSAPGKVIEGGADMIKEGIGRILGTPTQEAPPPPPEPPAKPEETPEEPDLIDRGIEGLGRMLGR